MQPTVMRAVGYRRVSSQEQTEGHSLDAQTNHIQNFVQSQGWHLVQIYTDAGISAKKGSYRPAFEQMLKDARDGKFDVVVVDKIDRFYRHLTGLLTTLEQLDSVNVSVASVQERLDLTTPWGKLMLTVLGMLAEIYITNLRQETKKGHRQRARSGLWSGGIPFGYCKGTCANCDDPNGKDYCPNYGHPNLSDGKHLIAHPIESIGVKLAFEWYASGEHSFTSIAEGLSKYKVALPDGSELVIRQKGHKGYSKPGVFSKDVVRALLHRQAYTGKVPYIGVDDKGRYRSRMPPIEVFEGQHPALISQELFDQATRVRESYGRFFPVRNKRELRCFILTGILKCGYCGSNLRGVSCQKKYFSYDDGSKIDRLIDCPQKPVKARMIEDKIAEMLRFAIVQADEEKTIEILKGQLTQAENRYKRAQELYLAGQIDREYYEQELELFEESSNRLQKDRLHATMALHDLVRTDLARWDVLAPIEKKRLLRLAVEAAWVRGNALVAVKPTIAFRPIMCNRPSAGMGLSDCGEGGTTFGRYQLQPYDSWLLLMERMTIEDAFELISKTLNEADDAVAV